MRRPPGSLPAAALHSGTPGGAWRERARDGAAAASALSRAGNRPGAWANRLGGGQDRLARASGGKIGRKMGGRISVLARPRGAGHGGNEPRDNAARVAGQSRRALLNGRRLKDFRKAWLPDAFPVRHPGRIAQLVEQLTLNQRVQGSSPCAPTNKFKDLISTSQERSSNMRPIEVVARSHVRLQRVT